MPGFLRGTTKDRAPAKRGGAEITINGLGKSFGQSNVWSDMSFTVPPGEITALIGPSGTGKSVFVSCILGLLKPETGSIVIHGTDIARLGATDMREMRKRFGVLFQSSGLFGSINLYDNVAFPLRERTRMKEREIRPIVMEKLEMVGLGGEEAKLPHELSGGMRKRAGLARALALEPEVVILDEPDSGLDPVRIAYLNQLIVDLNAVTDSTFVIVTHDMNTTTTLADNIGVIFRQQLVMFGARELVLSSSDPVVAQFMQGSRFGPIGMSEERDAAGMPIKGEVAPENLPLPKIRPQLKPTNGQQRPAEARRLARVRQVLPHLPADMRRAIEESMASPSDN
ncbi:MAG TPA: ATP-binding cassette domain-containing protein [Pseudonocardia sp.]|jgi:phospholipid/cholesterol/gamma-HCH transport system ATP-binding protein|nr:ATP-binding cassette domain-containing protein [Pseudonocardia sp.]